MNKPVAIHWFRQDLRLSDNPALYEASKNDSVLTIYILDDTNSGEHKMGGASRFWLNHSLSALRESLDQNLSIYHGDPLEILLDLLDRFNVKDVY